MGFSSFDLIPNLDGIFVVLVVYVLQILLNFLLHIVVLVLHKIRTKQKTDAVKAEKRIPKSRKLKWVIKKIGLFNESFNLSLMFNQVMVIFMEGILTMTVSVSLRYQHPVGVAITDMHTYVVSEVTLYFILVYSGMVLYFLQGIWRIDGAELRKPGYYKRYGQAYESYNLIFDYCRLHILLEFLRKVLFGILFTLLQAFPANAI